MSIAGASSFGSRDTHGTGSTAGQERSTARSPALEHRPSASSEGTRASADSSATVRTQRVAVDRRSQLATAARNKLVSNWYPDAAVGPRRRRVRGGYHDPHPLTPKPR